MLRELSIKNFAIIDDLRVDFSGGLTVFSGETGAGKSIIVNAVNLLLGGRVSSRLVRTGAQTAELGALFAIDPGGPTAERMDRCGYDASEGLLIRRIIARNDRHRIYINGSLATIQSLSEITENLASISGQHANQGLLKTDRHLRLLDRYGGLTPLRRKVRDRFREMTPLMEQLDALESGRDRLNEQRALLEFQEREIRSAAVTPDEDMALELERSRLRNAQALHQVVYESLQTLYDQRDAVVERLAALQKNLESAAAKDPLLAGPAGALAAGALELENVVADLRAYASGLVMDPRRLEVVEQRMDLLNRLKRKYGGSLEAVMDRLGAIDRSMADMADGSVRIEALKQQLEGLRERMAEDAQRLSLDRERAAGRMAEQVQDQLASLKMASAAFQVALSRQPASEGTRPWHRAGGMVVTESGVDRAEFLIAPNVGEGLKPLAAIASGGELSRVVLALKAILAKTDAVQTVVFDEVDAGIGGGVAEVVGRKLAELAGHHQVVCITHLPQIARFADHHFKIDKQLSGQRTRTTLHRLGSVERVAEIARMLGGETITPTTLEHARELLDPGSNPNPASA